MRTKHRTNFRSLFASTESAGLPPIEDEESVVETGEVTEVAPAVAETTDVAPVTEPVEGEGATDTEVELELTPEEADAEIAETNAAGDEVEIAVTEAESEIEEVQQIAEVNEEFVQEAQKSAEEDDFEQVTATIEASNEALRILTGTERYDIKSISFENYSNERVRATMLRVSIEAMEERTGNIMQRAWEAIKKMIRAALNFIVDLISRFKNQEKRLEKIRAELKDLKGSQRLVVKNKNLANRMVADGKVQGIRGVTGLMKSMPKSLEIMEKRLKAMNEFYKNSLTANSDRSYAALIQALSMDPATPLTAKVTDKFNLIGGFTMTNRFESKEGVVDYKYEFSHTVPTEAGEDVVLPTPAEMYQITGTVLESYKNVKAKAEEIKRAYKLSEGTLGASFKAARAVGKAGGTVTTGVERGKQASIINQIYNKAFIRPVLDLLKVAAYQLQTTAMLGVSVIRVHKGENADVKSTSASTESFNGTVATGTVDKLRSESPEDDTQLASDSGVTKDEEITPASDDELNEHEEEATVTPKKMTIEEFEDTNAAEIAESLEDITAALEDLEQREGALDDTIRAIEILEDAEGEGGLNSAGAALLELSAESVNRLMGFKDMPQVTASVESYQTVSGRRMANAASMESFKDRANEIIEKLKKALKMIWDWITHMSKRFYEMVVSSEKRAKALLEKLKTVKATPEGSVTNKQVLRMISASGKVGAEVLVGTSIPRASKLLATSHDLAMELSALQAQTVHDEDRRGQMGKLAADKAREILTKEGVKFNDDSLGEMGGLLGTQKLVVTIDPTKGLTRAGVSSEDGATVPESAPLLSVEEATKVVTATLSLIEASRRSRNDTEKVIAEMGKFIKGGFLVKESRDKAKGDKEATAEWATWAKDTQQNARGLTQLLTASFKVVNLTVNASLRYASYTAGVKPKADDAA